VAKVVVARCLATYKKCEQANVTMVNSGSIPLVTTNCVNKYDVTIYIWFCQLSLSLNL